jgi:hypothetical protein
LNDRNRQLLVSTFTLALAASVSLFSVACTVEDPGVDTGGAGAGSTAGASSGGSSNAAGSSNSAGVNSGAGTSSSTGGVTGQSGSGSSGGSAGAQGSSGATGTAGSNGSAGTSSGSDNRTGMSAGCTMAAPGEDSSTKFIKHEVHMTGLDPAYLVGGKDYDNSGPYDFSFRPYGVRLPDGYDSSKPYAVTIGGGGCGGSAENFAGNPGGGLQIAGNGKTIQIGLSYISGCFNDGGPSIDNRPDTPEEPYFRAVMAEVEAHYCVDKSQVFMAGYSSGGWEAFTLGCAASDIIRGIGTDEGGLRTMHPSCKKPIAAVMVAGQADTENPIGPLDPVADKGAVDRLGSLGSAPGRDEILLRNGCNGTATTPYQDAKYGACVKYTGCPPAYPVVWCALPDVGHNNSTYNGTNYSPGPMWDVLSMLPKP